MNGQLVRLTCGLWGHQLSSLSLCHLGAGSVGVLRGHNPWDPTRQTVLVEFPHDEDPIYTDAAPDQFEPAGGTP